MTGILNLAARRRGHPGPEVVPAPAAPLWGRCTIPTYDGSGITVHPSVVDMGRKWNGYRWWQANTPFPGDNERLENPCIWGSNDCTVWEVPQGLVNPLRQPPPSPGYNSDTELTFDPDTQTMICYVREYYSGIRLYAYTSTNGSSWHLHPEVIMTYTGEVSPAVWRKGPGDWRMWCFFGGVLRMFTASNPLGPWTNAGDCTMTGGGAGSRWHGDVIRYKDRWIGIYSESPSRQHFTMTCEDDGMTWTVSNTSIGTSYRPTMLPSTASDHLDLWVGTAIQYYNRKHESLWPAT